MSFVCSKCNAKFVYRYELILHRNCHKIVKRTEEVVSESSDRKSGKLDCMEHHIYQYDGVDCHYKHQKYRCGECSKEFLYEKSWRTHIETHELKNECVLCDKTFTCKRYLKEHLQMHTHETPYKCSICGKPFLRKDKLIAHGGTHAKKAKENLGPHNRLQPRKGIFKCKQCPKQYTRKQHLEVHSLSHSTDLPHVCEYCGRQFWRVDHLRTHENVHKYDAITNKCLCAICGELFFKDLVKPHMIEHHSGNMQFKCDKCDKAFKSKGNLIYHNRSHVLESVKVDES